MTETPAFRILTALACDDIRREETGKLIAIGIYARNIRFNQLPAASVISFLAIAETDQIGEFPLEFRVIKDGKDQIYQTKQGKLKTAERGRTLINVPNVVVEVSEPSKLTLEYNYNNQGWQAATDILIEGPL
jgi:hypothetical protein